MQLNFNSWINKGFSSTEVNSTWSLRQLFSRQFLLYSRFNSHFCFGSVVQQGTKLRGRVRINRSVQHFYIKALSLASFQRSSPTDKSACTPDRCFQRMLTNFVTNMFIGKSSMFWEKMFGRKPLSWRSEPSQVSIARSFSNYTRTTGAWF